MDLTKYVQQVSREDFGREFRHTAHWNNRLRTTGGRFFTRDGHLDFNPKLYEEYGIDIFRKIVRHELCHYHLYYQNKGYKHGDRDFKGLLQAVDGLRYAPSRKSTSIAHLYRCKSCNQEFVRRRRIDLKKYRCEWCRSPLQQIEKSENQS